MTNKKDEKEKITLVSGGSDMVFDDCPICRAMKAAQERGKDLSMEELRQAFDKAKDAGGIVGGEWFDEKDKE